MRCVLRAIIATILLSFGTVSAQPAPQKIALVIGNGDYRSPGWSLTNPPRDARLIGDRLKALGYDVDLVRDATREQMLRAFERFGQRLRAAGPEAVSVFYYAGHGAQSNGVNHLVPVDSSARTMDRLRLEAPPAQLLLDYMTQAGNAVNVVILDACRDVPLEEGLRGGSRGLAAFGDLPNVFVAYAASPGRTAADGSGRNSPYATALAQAMADKPGTPISLLFEEVQASVFRDSGFSQKPDYRNGLVVPGWSFAADGVAPPMAAAGAPRDIAADAIAALAAEVDAAPTDQARRFALARALLAAKSRNRALATLDAGIPLASDAASRSALFLEIARTHLGAEAPAGSAAPIAERERGAAAIAALGRAIEADPSNADARLLRGKLAFSEAMSAPPGQTRDDLQRASQSRDATIRADAYHHLSLMEVRARQHAPGQGDGRMAVAFAERAIADDQLNYGYRTHACLVIILFGPVLANSSRCVADELRAKENYPLELLHEGMFQLRRASEGTSPRLYDLAAQSFAKGLAIVEARGEVEVDATLRARLIAGQGIALNCSGMQSMGDGLILGLPVHSQSETREYYRSYGLLGCRRN